MENWFNQYPIDGKRVEEEPLKRVSYSPFKDIFYEVPKKENEKKKRAVKKYIGETKCQDCVKLVTNCLESYCAIRNWWVWANPYPTVVMSAFVN